MNKLYIGLFSLAAHIQWKFSLQQCCNHFRKRPALAILASNWTPGKRTAHVYCFQSFCIHGGFELTLPL